MTVVYLYGFECLAETKAMSSAKKFLDKAQLYPFEFKSAWCGVVYWVNLISLS